MCAFKYGDFRLKRKMRQKGHKMSGKRMIEGAQHIAGRLLDILICKGSGSSFPDILPA
jgi:hypothetical protein